MADPLLNDPVEYLRVYLGPAGGAEISFIPKTYLQFPKPWTFNIEVARSLSGPWTVVVEDADGWVVEDTSRYTWDVVAELWYRVVLVDGEDAKHASRPVALGNYWDRASFLKAREVCRRAYQKLRLGSGTAGWLLKPLTWGDPCPACGNAITNSPTNSQCETCYGTGYNGGYYAPYQLTLELQNMTARQAYREHLGKDILPGIEMLCVNFPMVFPKDVWIDAGSGMRYRIQGEIRALASMRGVPLIVTGLMQPIETTDVLYAYPTPSR